MTSLWTSGSSAAVGLAAGPARAMHLRRDASRMAACGCPTWPHSVVLAGCRSEGCCSSALGENRTHYRESSTSERHCVVLGGSSCVHVCVCVPTCPGQRKSPRRGNDASGTDSHPQSRLARPSVCRLVVGTSPYSTLDLWRVRPLLDLRRARDCLGPASHHIIMMGCRHVALHMAHDGGSDESFDNCSTEETSLRIHQMSSAEVRRVQCHTRHRRSPSAIGCMWPRTGRSRIAWNSLLLQQFPARKTYTQVATAGSVAA